MADSDEIIRIRTNDPGTDRARNPAPTIWSELRRLRRGAGLDVADIAQKARLSATTVEAIEAGAVERLPIGDAGRKEVVRLCEALGANPEPFLEAMRDRTRGPALGRKFERQRPQRRRSRIVIFGLVWGLVAVGFLVAWLTRGSEDGAPTQDTVAVATSLATAPPETSTAPTTQTPTTALTPATPRTFDVTVVAAREDVWVQATVDGQRVSEGLVRRGESVNAKGSEVALVIGRPAAVDVTVNGEAVPAEANMAFP